MVTNNTSNMHVKNTSIPHSTLALKLIVTISRSRAVEEKCPTKLGEVDSGFWKVRKS